MKHINKILIILILLNGSLYSQDYDLYSSTWSYSNETKTITPKNFSSFSYPCKEMLSSIDTNKINSYLLKSFNDFRSDYGKPKIIEDNDLSSQSKSYAKKLSSNFTHDPNMPSNQDEVIATINYVLISKFDYKSSDINKLIADCCFDIFISSNGHMGMLLSDNYKLYGFGVYQNERSFSVCVRAYR